MTRNWKQIWFECKIILQYSGILYATLKWLFYLCKAIKIKMCKPILLIFVTLKFEENYSIQVVYPLIHWIKTMSKKKLHSNLLLIEMQL